MIDLKIRHETNNRKSLDDVVVFLNRWFAERGTGFEEGDIERACTAISNYDFSEFFARHVRGVLDPPLAEYFAYAGIDYAEEHHTMASLPFDARRGRNGFAISNAKESKVVEAGDVILSFDGQANVRAATFLRDHKPGDRVKLEVRRAGQTSAVEVALVGQKRMIPSLRFAEKPTEQQLRIRESWLTGK